MINQGKFPVLGVLISAVDYEAAVTQIIQAAQQHQTLLVTALAVHGVMTGALDRVHRYRLNQFDLITPDGQPVRWALNWLYKTGLPDRVYGPILMLKVCERAAQENLSVYFYGNRPANLEKLIKNLQQRFPGLQIAGSQPSKFRPITPAEKQEVIAAIRQSGADILFVGLGCPRQETWVYEYRDHLALPMIAVGAAFDFHSGNVPQAPTAMQRNGLEWLFRFMQEPRRLWKRYVFLNPLYLILLFLQGIQLYQLAPEKSQPPSQEMNFG